MKKHEVPSKDFGKEFSLIHEAVVTGRKVGADHDFWKLIGNNRMVYYRMVHFAKNGCKDPFIEETDARSHMKSNFISIHAMSNTMMIFSENDLEYLSRVPFSENVIEQHAETHLLFPYIPTSVYEMHKKHHPFFVDGYKSYLYQGLDWAHEKSPLGWYMVRKDAHPNSEGEQWDSQIKLKGFESSPSVSVLVYLAISYYKLYGKLLFTNPVRSSDQDRDGFYMMVNTEYATNREGIVIRIDPSPSRHSTGSNVGIASEVLPMFR